MRPHINARVASAQTEHSVPVKSQLIPNLPTELSPTKEMESNPMVNHPLPPMEREPPRRGVDASKVSKGIETLREGEGKSCGWYTREWRLGGCILTHACAGNFDCFWCLNFSFLSSLLGGQMGWLYCYPIYFFFVLIPWFRSGAGGRFSRLEKLLIRNKSSTNQVSVLRLLFIWDTILTAEREVKLHMSDRS